MAEGNCDYNFSRDKEDIFELGDHVAFVTHGDAYGVSWGEEELVSKAQEMGADVVFYGHTHCPAFHYYEKEGVTVFNPGSIASKSLLYLLFFSLSQSYFSKKYTNKF